MFEEFVGVFPAYVGMSPIGGIPVDWTTRVPRIRGDEPVILPYVA